MFSLGGVLETTESIWIWISRRIWSYLWKRSRMWNSDHGEDVYEKQRYKISWDYPFQAKGMYIKTSTVPGIFIKVPKTDNFLFWVPLLVAPIADFRKTKKILIWKEPCTTAALTLNVILFPFLQLIPRGLQHPNTCSWFQYGVSIPMLKSLRLTMTNNKIFVL
jgi:hypothetical protein